MHFDHSAQGHGSTISRLLAVAAFHVLIAFGILAGMTIKQKPLTHFMPEPITQVDTPPPKPVDPPVNFDVTPINPPISMPLPIPAVDVAVPEVAHPIATEQPQLTVGKPGVVGGTSTGDAKPVAKAKPVLGKGSCEVPPYPASAAREGATGTVRWALLVGVNGRVTDAKLEKTSGHRDLDKAARVALSTCRFTPVSVDGVPEPAWTVMEYIWTLDN